MEISDKSILLAVRFNKEEGIRLLFEKYFIQLVLYVEYLVGDKAIAEDLIQELFVRLWQVNYLENFNGTDLKNYLFRSAKNSYLTYDKKKDLLKNSIDLAQVQVPEEVFFDFKEKQTDSVLKELGKLPERTQMVVKEVMVNRKKYQEVADEMSISINTVKSLLKDGTKKLRTKLLGTKSEQ